MLKDITIGKYLETGSFVHNIDPRTKIKITALFMLTIFLINKISFYLPLFLMIVFAVRFSKLPFSYILKGIKPLRLIIIITFIINLLTSKGEVLFSFWIFNITYEGLLRASFMSVRLILLVMGTSILTLTTSPIKLTDALEKIFKPLSNFGFPAHELAMMMTIALRFIPTLTEEADKIMKAQMARGADFESGNLIERAKNLIPLLVPLFINSIRRAGDLAVAMEARCYRGGEGRTRLNELVYTKKDSLSMAVSSILLISLVILSRLTPWQI